MSINLTISTHIFKTCFRCNKTKHISDYYRHSEMKDGHLNKCKECTKKDARENDEDYGKTEKGVVRVLYKTQRANSIRRKHNPPDYNKTEFKEWLYRNSFKELYEAWVDSGFEKHKKPSADRIDNFKGYELSNIQLITWGENFKNQMDDVKNGMGTGGLRCKPVLKFDSEGSFIDEYVSFSSARREHGYSMERALKSGKIDRHGFQWKFK